MQAGTSTIWTTPGKGQVNGWHALFWFLGFFGFMFLVNGIFLWTAITTFPGEDVERSYAAGLDFNAELARSRRQASEGWRAEIGTSGALPDLRLDARLFRSSGEPLVASSAYLQLRHPADRRRDRTLELTATDTGAYSAELRDTGKGAWTAILTADVDPATEGQEFRAMRELHIR